MNMLPGHSSGLGDVVTRSAETDGADNEPVKALAQPGELVTDVGDVAAGVVEVVEGVDDLEDEPRRGDCELGWGYRAAPKVVV